VTPATARRRARPHARAQAPPRGPRRVSGPARTVTLPAGAVALPRRGGATGLFLRVRALPEHKFVDRLLRSRLWIWLIGVLLGGIVAMQVSLLKLNSGISRAVETAATLERQNADLEAAIARKSAPDRIENGATALGMVMPPAGDVRYLTAGPRDAERAAKRMQPPSDAAAALLANHGIEPGSLAAPVEQASTAPAPTAAPEPVATPAPTAVATPVPAVEQQQPPPTTAAPATGGAVAGQG
jgi:hypothetical protein